jgi:Zn-dependent peptidase ImmA (M78 family)
VLNYPVDFFYQTFEVYPAGMHLYRKHKGLPAKDLAQVAAFMNIFREHVKGLLVGAEIEYKPIKECDIDEYGTPAEAAKAFRQYLHLPRGPIKNLTKVLESVGIVVLPMKASRLFSGASLLTEKPNYIAIVNSEMPGDRLRFTLAHELGHIVMHSIPNPDMEQQADRFASEFLMPAQEIGPYLSNLTLDKLASLKTYWKVSMGAILVHAHALKKITDRHYRTLWMKMGSAGYRLKEPLELEIPVERPTLVSEIIEFHIKELGYDVPKLSKRLKTNDDELASLYSLPQSKLKLIQASRQTT